MSTEAVVLRVMMKGVPAKDNINDSPLKYNALQKLIILLHVPAVLIIIPSVAQSTQCPPSKCCVLIQATTTGHMPPGPHRTETRRRYFHQTHSIVVL